MIPKRKHVRRRLDRYSIVLGCAFGWFLVFGTTLAAAQNWPARPITLVVPLAAGGGSDGLVRVVAPRLGEILGQTVVVENIGGAGGMIGASRVAKALPDGYEILLGTSGTQAVAQTIAAKPLYDAATDFTPVALVFEVPQVLITRKTLPPNNFAEFVAYAKAHQASLQYGSSGAGGSGHLACALLNATIGIEVAHIPYRGGGPAMQDLIGGRLDYQCALANIALPQVAAGHAKAMAVLSPERSSVIADVPSLGEEGLPDFDAAAWNGIFLPKGTPLPIVDKLHAALMTTIETPAIRDRLAQLGATVVASERRSPAYLQRFVESEIEKWARIIRSAKIQAN
jgi:tripartite-type tricarboxylate transporter receptor subunit TctC